MLQTVAILASTAILFLTGCTPELTSKDALLIGTYTRKEGHVDGKAAGIYTLRMDAPVAMDSTTGIVNPSYICLSPDGATLFAVSEIGPDVDSTGYVYSYQHQSGRLKFISRQPSHSFAPCYASVHPSGKWLYVANYVGGMVARYAVGTDGSLAAPDTLRLSGKGDHPRQEASHPHSTVVSPDGQWVMVADLGTDKVHTYHADAATWTEVSQLALPAASGPRHLVFHPTRPYAFLLNELSNTVAVLHYNAANGSLNILAYHPMLPDGFTDFSLGADIHVTPDGQYLYASNRGHNSLVGYRINAANGGLERIGFFPTLGDFPRNFTIHPSGAYLTVANQNSDNIVRFQIDPATGQLTEQGQWTVKTPVCLVHF